MPEISAVLRKVYFDEKSRWQHKAAVFKVMDIMEVYNSDFGLLIHVSNFTEYYFHE